MNEGNALSASSSVVGLEEERPMSTAVEVTEFDDGTSFPGYRAKVKGGPQYLLPRPLGELLLLFDGSRTIREIAISFKQKTGIDIAAHDVKAIIGREFEPRGLAYIDGIFVQSKPEMGSKKKSSKLSLDFVLRFPLASPKQVSPVAKRLTILFSGVGLGCCIFVIVLAHLAFYGEPVNYLRRTPFEMLLAYLLAFMTVCVHELGHAAAARRFGCEHGEIGFCLYLIFPALYLDLSQAWQLSRWERAIIDLGGIYLQLLMVVPLYCLYWFTMKPYYADAIHLVDFMVLCAINPLLKFDGYWLLVDLAGLPNLQRRSITFLKGLVLWPVRRCGPPGFESIHGLSRKVMMIGYSLTIGTGIVLSGIFMCFYAPEKFHELTALVLQLPAALGHSRSESMLDLIQITGIVFFFLFLIRFMQMIAPVVIKPRVKADRSNYSLESYGTTNVKVKDITN
jgi:hypothetical protein